MKVIDDKTIVLERELSELDQLVFRFVSLVEKHTPYVLVSGYVAILFGRSRGTEDIDLFIPRLSELAFVSLYTNLCSQGFWALNSNNTQELFSMLEDGLSIRFAKSQEVIPNFEMKFVKDALDVFTLREKITVDVLLGRIYIAPIDLQIAYKRFVLRSPKDLEDAHHLQELFVISDENVNKYKQVLKEHGRF